MAGESPRERAVQVPVGAAVLDADVVVPPGARGVVLFAHGSGSGRHSPRNQQVARGLQRAGLATMLMDLLTGPEEEVDRRTRHLRFDIPMLGTRLTGAVDWLEQDPATRALPVATFGASTGAAAALIAAADRPGRVDAVVSRGGRPDLAADALPRVLAPVLLVVGSLDPEVLELNRAAAARMTTTVQVEVVEGATHLFGEPGTLERVTDLATAWIDRWTGRPGRPD